MTIEILETKTIINNTIGITTKHVRIAIDNGGPVYEWNVGGLPETGDLQSILEAREAELLAGAIAKGQLFDVYELTEKRVLRGVALVIMDELNGHAAKINDILAAIDAAISLVDLQERVAAIADLPLRDESQIRGAIKNKLTGL